MGAETLRGVLLWCTILNSAVLAFWALLFLTLRDRLHGMTRRFRMSAEQFDAINYAGITLYKVGILLFNLVPYIALRIVG